MTCSAAGVIAASEAINRVYWNCKEGKMMISLIINVQKIMTPDFRIDITIKWGAMIFIMSPLNSGAVVTSAGPGLVSSVLVTMESSG